MNFFILFQGNSSWNSKLDTASFHPSNAGQNPTFHFSSGNKKSALIANKKNPNLKQTNNSSISKLIAANSSSSQKQRTSSISRQAAAKPGRSEKSQRIKKNKLIDLDYDDELKYDYFENESLRDDTTQRLNDPNNDLYTDDLNEETSETTG